MANFLHKVEEKLHGGGHKEPEGQVPPHAGPGGHVAQPGAYGHGSEPGAYGHDSQPGAYGHGSEPGAYGHGSQPGEYGHEGGVPGQKEGAVEKIKHKVKGAKEKRGGSSSSSSSSESDGEGGRKKKLKDRLKGHKERAPGYTDAPL